MTSSTQTKTSVDLPRLQLFGSGEANDGPDLAKQRYLKERLAGAFRLFHKLGYDETIAGHISMRDPIHPDRFWLNPYGVAFDHICVSDLLCIDHEGKVVEGGKPGDGQIYNAAGFAIHESIHRELPSVHAVAHSHSIFGKAFSMLGRNVGKAENTQGAVPEYGLSLYGSFDGPVLDGEEGRHICEAMGPYGKGVILQNHGILTALDAARGELDLEGQEAAVVFRTNGGEEEAWRQAQALYEALDAETSGDYKL
ncbi:hypothetical protein JCM24511_07375 [Saitozyma sp. JCM 24511]|nr:hypothetical protein JCM24511_07375 [Saitozyma sp. JCM 24511]